MASAGEAHHVYSVEDFFTGQCAMVHVAGISSPCANDSLCITEGLQYVFATLQESGRVLDGNMLGSIVERRQR